MAKSKEDWTIQFLVDYRGKLTREQYFIAGSIVNPADCDPPIDAEGLVGEGRAEWVDAAVDEKSE